MIVSGRPWAEGERCDWGSVPRGGLDLRPAGRSYAPVFRTHPAPDVRAPLDFAVLGDYGVGTVADTEAGRRQRRVAAVLDRLADDLAVRLVITMGDDVYKTPGRRGSAGTGALETVTARAPDGSLVEVPFVVSLRDDRGPVV